MAMKQCPACGSAVSSAAGACPSCGHPLGKKPLFSKPAGCVVQLLGAAALLTGAGAFIGAEPNVPLGTLALIAGAFLLVLGRRTK